MANFINETKPYTGKGTDFYFASEGVAKTVNLAIALNRPLLVEGEPGCGKTQLAYSIAKEKGLPEPTKISVKSTTKAKDLLYSINSLRRFQDAQNPNNKDAACVFPYLVLGPIGRAIHQSARQVLLIDEIDKADLDFPNDLLDALDNFTFQIEELPLDEQDACVTRWGFGRQVTRTSDAAPIVVITSNRERRLPEAFLRRCLYLRLRFPETAGELEEIVRMNTKGEAIDQGLLSAAVKEFQGIRHASLGATQKPPSTSELIDWIRVLYLEHATEKSLIDGGIPRFWEVLFKTGNDQDAFRKLREGAKG